MDLDSLFEAEFSKGYTFQSIDLFDSFNSYQSSVMDTYPNGVRRYRDLAVTIWWNVTATGELYFRLDQLVDEETEKYAFHHAGNFLTPKHIHDYIELAYVHRGRLVQQIAGKDHVFNQGEICLIDTESEHADCVLFEDCQVIYIGMATSFFDNHIKNEHSDSKMAQFIREIILRRKDNYQYVRFVPIKNISQEIPSLLCQLLMEFMEKKTGHIDISTGLIKRILYRLLVEYQPKLTYKEQKQVQSLIFADIESYIRQNLADASMQSICSTFNYNKNKVYQIIRFHTGLTYKRLLQKLRLEKAVQVLNSTNVSIEAAAVQVGYKNLSYFYRIFEEMYGDTPNRYRTK